MAEPELSDAEKIALRAILSRDREASLRASAVAAKQVEIDAAQAALRGAVAALPEQQALDAAVSARLTVEATVKAEVRAIVDPVARRAALLAMGADPRIVAARQAEQSAATTLYASTVYRRAVRDGDAAVAALVAEKAAL